MLLGRDELGHRSETVRRANLSAIVRELHSRGPLSRSELVARTGQPVDGVVIDEACGRAAVRQVVDLRLGGPDEDRLIRRDACAGLSAPAPSGAWHQGAAGDERPATGRSEAWVARAWLR